MDHIPAGPAPSSVNKTELARHLASDRYSEKDCKALLRKDEAGRAAEYLRATDPQRALELAVTLVESATWETQAAVLSGQRRLIATPGRVFTSIVNNPRVDKSKRRALARPLVEWLEVGRDEHLGLLDRELAECSLESLAHVFPRDPAHFSRLWRLVEPKLGPTFEAQATAVLETGESPFVALAAEHLSAVLGVELQSLPVPFSIGGVNREDVVLHALKPMLELIWRHRPELLWDHLAAPFKKVRSWGIPWLLDFAEPVVAMVDAPPTRAIVMRVDRLVVAVSGKFKGSGRVASKLHKTTTAAEKDFEKRLVAAETKLGSSRTPWDGVVAPAVYSTLRDDGPLAALRDATRRQLVDVEGLMKRGADPHEHGWTWMQFGAVHRFAEAGVTKNLGGSLVAQAGRYFNQDDPYLGQEACIRLMDAGADIHAVDRAGWTALHYAAAHGWTRLIAALLDAGADKDRPCGPGTERSGQTPLAVAEHNERHLAVAMLR